jgi:hypothetical protein
LSGANLIGSVADQRGFRNLTVDLKDFYAQWLSPRLVVFTKGKDNTSPAFVDDAILERGGTMVARSRMISCGRSRLEDRPSQ